MTGEDAFSAWAPEGAVWSPWAKPVLFAQRLTVSPPDAIPIRRADYLWLPDASGRTAIVVDLPGVESVRTGVALARRGYRPVPLYNTSEGPSAVIDVASLITEVLDAAGTLHGVTLPADAPPAFLLDSRRMRPAVLPGPGKFDNRWVTFPQDFPSATFLRARGVAEVLLVHEGGSPQEDLAHVLLRWQQAGIRIQAGSPSDTPPQELVVTRPSWFRRAWYRALTLMRLRRNNAGGFGAVIPIPTPGGGGRGIGYG